MATFLSNLTLGKKITFLTALGLLFGVGIFSSVGLRAVNQATEAMLGDRLTTAGLVADYIDETLGRSVAELRNTAQSIRIDRPDANIGSQVGALVSAYSRLSIDAQGIYLLDPDGKLLWSKPETNWLGSTDETFSRVAIESMKGKETGVSGLVMVPSIDRPVVLVSSYTQPDAGGRAGLLVAGVDLAQSSIGGFIRPIRLGQTGYVEIVDRGGIVVSRTEPGPKLAPFEKSDHSGRFAALIAAGEPTRGVCHTCHEPDNKVARKDVLAFVPLTQADWGVVIRQSETEAMSSTRELAQNLLFFGAGLVTVALVFVLVTTRDVGSRIRALTTASQKIAEGNLGGRVDVQGRDEVGTLAQALDYMRVKLKTSYDDLEQKTKELTSLLSVSEILTRTADLPAIFDTVVARAVEIIPGADAGALLLENNDRSGFAVQSSIGLDRELLPGTIVPPLGFAGVWTPGSDKNPGSRVETATGMLVEGPSLRDRVKGSIFSEILDRDRPVGAIAMLSFKGSHSFADSDRRLLQAIAYYTAIAIERSRLAKEASEVHALQEADRLRSQFISSVSHELRTPLTLIKGCATSLLRPGVSWDAETQKQFLGTIDDKTDELRDLIDKLLQSAKLEAGAFKLVKEPALLPRIARKIVDDAEHKAKKQVKKHSFLIDFPPEFPVVEADVRCVEQVFRNLLENAMNYSPVGGEIAVRGKVDGARIVVSISDQGIGIPPEHRDRLFERFYRVESPLTRGVSGSGLGLSITRAHVQAHGGDVWVESEVGKGSTFYFSLPFDGRNAGGDRQDGEDNG